ncbi:MAG: hypothetical protein RM347_021170 [Nostoc sp. ChiQUE02]|nr:hypothetical protein [Nostoc sp. ChiQUE02]MDZ8228754.1 hypothetical protein [Nostoc sp. ChiQUE02]
MTLAQVVYIKTLPVAAWVQTSIEQRSPSSAVLSKRKVFVHQRLKRSRYR